MNLLVDNRTRPIVSPRSKSHPGIRLAAFGIGAITGTTQYATTEWGPWNQADPKMLQKEVSQQELQSCRNVSYLAERVHLSLFFAVEQRIMVLHGNERCQSISECVIWAGFCVMKKTPNRQPRARAGMTYSA
jgi:hypothetical protein